MVTMIDVLIPARDEADTIGPLVTSLRGKPVNKVIVVDNGSADATGRVAESAGASVVRCDEIGKGQAIAKGLEEVATQRVMLCDGDLSPFKRYQVTGLATEFMRHGMVIGVPEFTQNVPWAGQGPLWGFLSGIRVLPTAMLRDLKERGLLFGYTVEVMLNRSARVNDIRVYKIPLYGVRGKVQWGKERHEAMRRDFEWMLGKDFHRLLTESRDKT
jgi:hypothetical protein